MSEIFVDGQFIGQTVSEVQIFLVNSQPEPIAIAPREVSIKLQAASINKDAIDALLMNLPPVPEEAKVTTRDFTAKLRNLQFHQDGGNWCTGTAGCVQSVTVSGDLENLHFFEPAKNRRFRRWNRKRVLRDCRTRARRREKARRHLRAAVQNIACSQGWVEREYVRIASVLGLSRAWMDELQAAAHARLRATASPWGPEHLEDLNFVRARFGLRPLTVEDL